MLHVIVDVNLAFLLVTQMYRNPGSEVLPITTVLARPFLTTMLTMVSRLKRTRTSTRRSSHSNSRTQDLQVVSIRPCTVADLTAANM